jgi:hypothetical protein
MSPTSIQKTLAGILTIALLAPFLFVSSTKPVHAQTGLFGCTAGSVGVGGGVGAAAAAFGLVVPVLDNANLVVNTGSLTKECILDGLVVLVREVLIANITRSIVNWINSGFNGQPSFVQNLGGFLLNVADEVAGTFIEGSELAFLCSPFNLDVRLALALDYYAQFRDRTACTLTGALQNIQDAFDYDTGLGWDAWYDMSVNSNNNAVGAFTTAQYGLRVAAVNAQGQQKTILDWGNGFRPFEQCDIGEDAFGQSTRECQTVTPGVVINEQLNNTISTGQRQLELADEIDEIIGALLGQLSQQILSGGGGLFGLSQSSFSRPSYLDQLTAQSEQETQAGLQSAGLSTADGGIELEQQYIDTKKTSLQRLSSSENALHTLRSCYATKATDTSLSGSDVAFAQQQITLTDTTLTTSINPLINSTVNDIADGESNIQSLVLINNHLEQASSLVSVQRIIDTELNPLIDNRILHTQQDLSVARQQGADLGDFLASLDAQTNLGIATCEDLGNNDN